MINNATSYMVISDMSRAHVSMTMPHEWLTEANSAPADVPAFMVPASTWSKPQSLTERFWATLATAIEPPAAKHRKPSRFKLAAIKAAAALLITGGVILGLLDH